MTPLRRTIPIAFSLLMLALPGGLAAAEADPADRFLDRSLEQVILPGYEALQTAAASEARAADALCGAPSAQGLSQTRAAFEELALAYARVELFRFGPAREDYRSERLFFWPDRRGRGLKQVEALLADEDPSALETESLRAKSVALQGLLALEYLLYGAGADALAEGASYRCGYAAALAAAIEMTAADLLADWREPRGFAAVLTKPGPQNPLFKSDGEALQELLRAAREQLEVVRDQKLEPALGESFEASRPTRAPLWRSGLAVRAMLANLDGVESLLQEEALAALLPEDDRYAAGSLAFELAQARGALEAATGMPFVEALENPEIYDRLSYARFPLEGGMEVLAETIPEALGLTMGFNSLDGD